MDVPTLLTVRSLYDFADSYGPGVRDGVSGVDRGQGQRRDENALRRG